MLQRAFENARKEAAQSLKNVLLNSIISNPKERSVKKKIASKLEGVAKLVKREIKEKSKGRLQIQEGNK